VRIFAIISIFVPNVQDEVRRKLEDIIRGVVIKEQSDTCTAIRNNLCSSFSTSTTVKKDFEGKSIIKKEQERFLQQLATQYNYWASELAQGRMLSRQGRRSQSLFARRPEKLLPR
jgi:hypothetical protein